MRAAFLFVLVSSAFFVTGGCAPSDPQADAVRPGTESRWKGEAGESPVYDRVFYGTAQPRQADLGVYYVLVGIRPVLGLALNEYKLPPLDFDFDRREVPFEMPARWVSGRRYLVFLGLGPVTEPGTRGLERILRILDLDESNAEATALARLRRTTLESALPVLHRDRVDKKGLEQWLRGARERVAGGRVSVADVVAALGPPDMIDEAWDEVGFQGSRRLGYVLDNESLTTVKADKASITREAVCIIFVFKGDRVCGVSQEPWICTVFLGDPESIRD